MGVGFLAKVELIVVVGVFDGVGEGLRCWCGGFGGIGGGEALCLLMVMLLQEGYCIEVEASVLK